MRRDSHTRGKQADVILGVVSAETAQHFHGDLFLYMIRYILKGAGKPAGNGRQQSAAVQEGFQGAGEGFHDRAGFMRRIVLTPGTHGGEQMGREGILFNGNFQEFVKDMGENIDVEKQAAQRIFRVL